MSIRNIKVSDWPGYVHVQLRMRTPSKPFKAGDILCLHMPDNTCIQLLVGPPKHPVSCADCTMGTWVHCVRTRRGICIRCYTEDNNTILEPDKILEEL